MSVIFLKKRNFAYIILTQKNQENEHFLSLVKP